MNDKNYLKRIETLKILCEDLWQKEQIRNETLEKHDWVLIQIKELKKITDCENCTVEIIKNKISEIVNEVETFGDKK